MKKSRQPSKDVSSPTADTPVSEPAPWRPIQDQVDLYRLGKLIEECSELQVAASRWIIQGPDGIDPASGNTARSRFQEEFADVMAQLELCFEHFGLDDDAMRKRADFKKERQRLWQRRLNAVDAQSS
jgi:hypothetical protein